MYEFVHRDRSGRDGAGIYFAGSDCDLFTFTKQKAGGEAMKRGNAKRLSLDLNSELYRMIKDRANREGMPLRTWIRYAILEKLGRPSRMADHPCARV